MRQKLWQLEEFPFRPERLNYYETIFTVGNGYLATRGTFEEGYANDIPTTLIHGIYDHAPSALVPELVNVPNWLPIHITVDGTPFLLENQNSTLLKPPRGAVLGYRRALHLDHALLRREVLFRAESGNVVRLIFERFASLKDVHVLAQRIQLIAVDGEPEIEIRSAIDINITNAGWQHWLPDTRTTADANRISVEAKTQQSSYIVGMASCITGPGSVHFQSSADGTLQSKATAFKLKQDNFFIFDKLTTIYSSRDVQQPLERAQGKLSEAAQIGYDRLLKDHESEWEKYWDDTDIQIEDDEAIQVALRFALYHILIAAPRGDDRVSIGAKTLSGFGYKGHVFWDTELFILPPLTVTQPQLARNLLMYRYHNLSGARKKAAEGGYEGAMYPWESTDTGEETTPRWSDPQPDGQRIRIWTGDSEQHISTDIAYAILQYWRWTGDDMFVRQYGAEIVLDTAVFWGSRVEAKNGRYELSQQIGPDEYHENVDNSVFTNRMVVWHLGQALGLLDWLHAYAPDDAQRLIQSLKITDDRLAHWRDIIAKMLIPFDEEKQIHIQFPGFFDLEYIPVPHYEPRTMSVQAILGHARTTQTQVIKQADVVMMMALLGDKVGSRNLMVNNWNTYFPRTDHGSSLSPAIHAWVAARLGLGDIAYELFQHAAAIDLEDNKGNIRDGIHGAASGGLWQALVFGFCGLTIDKNGDLQLDPKLPKHWRSVTFTVNYRGEKRRLVVNNPALTPPSA